MQMTCDPARINQHCRANTDVHESLDAVEKASARQHAATSQNHYANLENVARNVRVTQSSIEQEDRMYRVASEREESSPEISQTE